MPPKVEKETEAPSTIRDSIRAAFDEVKENEVETEGKKPEVKEPVETKEVKETKKKVEIELDETAFSLDENSEVEDNDEVETEEAETETKKEIEPQIELPASWNKKKDVWDKLDKDSKEFIAQREKEVSEGFAKYGADSKAFKELDAVIAPHRAEIQRGGYTEAQVIGTLFNWMTALSNPQHKIEAWKALGKNFGIDVEKITSAVSNSEVEPNSETQEINPAVQSIQSEVHELKRAMLDQQHKAAADYVNNWAKDKAHYQTVRPIMSSLLNSGAIPLKDGQIDLDEAYNQACYAHPQVREILNKEASEKATAELIAKKEAEEKARKEKILKAKKASASLKARAPLGELKPNDKLNGRQNTSVRDSIRSAMKEVQDA